MSLGDAIVLIGVSISILTPRHLIKPLIQLYVLLILALLPYTTSRLLFSLMLSSLLASLGDDCHVLDIDLIDLVGGDSFRVSHSPAR